MAAQATLPVRGAKTGTRAAEAKVQRLNLQDICITVRICCGFREFSFFFSICEIKIKCSHQLGKPEHWSQPRQDPRLPMPGPTPAQAGPSGFPGSGPSLLWLRLPGPRLWGGRAQD